LTVMRSVRRVFVKLTEPGTVTEPSAGDELTDQPVCVPSVPVQTMPTGIAFDWADPLVLVPRFSGRSWSYVVPGQSTWKLNTRVEASGSPEIVLLILILPVSRVLVKST